MSIDYAKLEIGNWGHIQGTIMAATADDIQKALELLK